MGRNVRPVMRLKKDRFRLARFAVKYTGMKRSDPNHPEFLRFRSNPIVSEVWQFQQSRLERINRETKQSRYRRLYPARAADLLRRLRLPDRPNRIHEFLLGRERDVNRRPVALCRNEKLFRSCEYRAVQNFALESFPDLGFRRVKRPVLEPAFRCHP